MSRDVEAKSYQFKLFRIFHYVAGDAIFFLPGAGTAL
jgi:hypothetical protein